MLFRSEPNWARARTDYRIQGIPLAVLIDRRGLVRLAKAGAEPASLEALSAEIPKLLAEK